MNAAEHLTNELSRVEAILEFAVGRMNRGVMADGTVTEIDRQAARQVLTEGLAALDAYEATLPSA